MGDWPRTVLVVVMLSAGVAMVGYAGYVQYASLSTDRTARRSAVRVAAALAGIALIIGASHLS